LILIGLADQRLVFDRGAARRIHTCEIAAAKTVNLCGILRTAEEETVPLSTDERSGGHWASGRQDFAHRRRSR
jgi:hypothetical protein